MAKENELEINSESKKSENEAEYSENNENSKFVELIDLDDDDSKGSNMENGDNEVEELENNAEEEEDDNVDDDDDSEIMILEKSEDDVSQNENENCQDDNQSETRKPHISQIKPELNEDIKEIVIDDDDDEEEEEDEDQNEVQDLSTKNTAINNDSINNENNEDKNIFECLAPKLSDQLVGFPTILKDIINLGDCIAIDKKSRSDIDIHKDYSILDCPSQVVPLILRKSNKFPPKLKPEKESNPNPPTPAPNNQNSKNMLTISDFYSSSVGKFLIGIGLSRVKQWYHKDAINKVRKQIRKEGEAEDLMEELKKQQEYLNCCRSANASYIFASEKCEHCDFRSEFKLVLNYHLIYPHMTSRKEYKCNYCQFSTRDSKMIVEHVEQLHEKKCKIEFPPQLYECPICTYESGVKSKAAAHIAKCLKFFSPEKLLINSKDDFFPTITPKPITQEDIKIYEATLQALRFAALNPQSKVPQITGLPAGLQQQMYMVQQQQLTRIAPGRTKKQNFEPGQNKSRIANPLLNQMKNVHTPQLYHMLSNSAGPQFLPNANFSGLSPNALSLINKQPMPKFNPPPPQPSRNSMISGNNIANNKPNILKQPNLPVPNSRVDNPKGSFVMCEICDGYIKDLEQLRTHMHWIHKVRIHPKMLASRPPLNCQKCQWRFFTDQGLERHLLGAHGLVTSNMQDMVNQNQDGGRCTICGRVFNFKLVTHMNQAHKINLKPAHLSYKCTVCAATFNLYRLFENHVYMVHSGSVKRGSNNDDSNQPSRKKMALDMAAANGN